MCQTHTHTHTQTHAHTRTFKYINIYFYNFSVAKVLGAYYFVNLKETQTFKEMSPLKSTFFT